MSEVALTTIEILDSEETARILVISRNATSKPAEICWLPFRRPVPMTDMGTSPNTRSSVELNAADGKAFPSRQTFTVDEAAEILGISRSTAYECVKDGSLPALRFRRRVVVTRAALDALLRAASPPA